MDKALRNTLRNAVTQCRKLLEDALAETLEGQYGVFRNGKIEDSARMVHLTMDEVELRERILIHLRHIRSGGFKDADAVEQLTREVAYTHLNRLAAYKMMEKRGLIREAVSRGLNSQGLDFYLAKHNDDAVLADTGKRDIAYRHYLTWQGAQFSSEIGVLFSSTDLANALFPAQRVIDEVLARINSEELSGIWAEDEAIGWIYQYFTPKELRDKARAESQAPRNSYELSFRNQFFTPRYVVEFLTDNTLGRIWYEMLHGDTALTERCRYLVRRPTEIFLNEGETAPETGDTSGLTQEELLRQPVYIPHRAVKDPRRLRVLDPACGSGHFLLYAFDLLAAIYEESWQRDLRDPVGGLRLRDDYTTLNALRLDIPRLILANNLHGIDIDARATQIAALALWLRAQRYYQEIGLKRNAPRPPITRGNLVCAEPMPGDALLLEEFVATLNPPLIGGLVRAVFNKMTLAGEAGSLLKIEEELTDAIAAAKKRYLEIEAGGGMETVSMFPDLAPAQPKQMRLDLSGIDDVKFFDTVEKTVLDALHAYARSAANGKGLQRQLFADDAARGFAFIDVCRKRYDVVLMNPPYGDSTYSVKEYLRSRYVGQPNDLYACFIERFADNARNGFLGGLTSHTFLNYSSFASLRKKVIIPSLQMGVVADFGLGILDAAMVRTAAFTIHASNQIDSVYFRLIEEVEKQQALAHLIERIKHGTTEALLFVRNQHLFEDLEDAPFAYWIPLSTLNRFFTEPRFNDVADCRLGVQTSNNERYLRLWVEIPSARISRDSWSFYAKGGEFSKYYSPVHLIIDWRGDGKHILAEYGQSVRLREPDQYFRSGINYPLVNEFGMNAAALPANCLFDNTSPSVFSRFDDSHLRLLLGVVNSRIFQLYVRCQTSTRHWQVGYLRKVPFPNVPQDLSEVVTELVEKAIRTQRNCYIADEALPEFTVPSSLGIQLNDTVTSTCIKCVLDTDNAVVDLIELDMRIDQVINKIYGLSDDELVALDVGIGSHPFEKNTSHLSVTENSFAELEETEDTHREYRVTLTALETLAYKLGVHPEDARESRRNQLELIEREFTEHCGALISYLAGVTLGRWDIRYATGEQPIPDLPDPFAPLPVCPPGMLQGADGLPLMQSPPGYPVEIQWDGVLVDDESHPADVVGRVRQVIELLWGERAAAIEREACEILGVKTLRDYFRKSGKGGFWDDHVKRYSKSRRQAPIYWLLQSSKKNYGLWLYYHRLDKDLLYKALVNYVEPKIRLEESRLNELRGQLAAAGNTGAAAKKLAGEVEKQEALLTELDDFRDKLKRAADLNLDPDLNDGVVLNIAPLWELVPWKVAKSYWDELLDGKYEWSTVSGQLKARGHVK